MHCRRLERCPAGTDRLLIGSLTQDERNVISGNKNAGVACTTDGTMGNMIMGNFIGTDVSGTDGLGNVHYGVLIEQGAFNNTMKREVFGLGTAPTSTGFGQTALAQGPMEPRLYPVADLA